MNYTLSDSYTEVSYILDILGSQYKNKIPKPLLKLIYSNRNNNDSNINSNFDITQISRNALIIISIFNLKYWEENESKKQLLKQIYAQNEKIYQDKISKYKNDNWLRKNVEQPKPTQELHLISQKNNSIWHTIKCFIKKILSKKENL